MIRAVVMMLEKDGKVIFTKRSSIRNSLAGRWCLPAGKIKSGESPIETARKEAMKELGLTLIDPQIVEEKYIEKEGEKKTLYFIKAKYEGVPVILEPEELDEIRSYTFPEFYETYSDPEIGHGLQYLKKRLLIGPVFLFFVINNFFHLIAR